MKVNYRYTGQNLPKKTPYKYKTKDLCNILGVSRFTIIRWEQKGLFTPPRSVGDHRVFTKGQLRQIKRAFSPDGKGYWHFKPDKPEDENEEQNIEQQKEEKKPQVQGVPHAVMS